jgi:threonine dehydrogenase-like Zn-dependent dehydrogenase
MRATVFHSVNDIRVDEVERPRAGVGEAVIRVTLTTICGTDLHIKEAYDLFGKRSEGVIKVAIKP